MKKYLLLPLALSMFSLLAVAQPKDGLYKEIKYQNTGATEQPSMKDTYMLLNNGKTYSVWTYEKGNSWIVRVKEQYLGEISNGNDKGVIVCTTNNAPTGLPHRGIQTKTTYTMDKNMRSDHMKVFMKLIGKAKKNGHSKQKLYGAWYCWYNRNTPYYKYYDKNHRIVLSFREEPVVDMTFTIEDMEYLKGGNSLEGNNFCKITWQGQHKYQLVYESHGHTFTESWKRTYVPDCVTSVFD